MEHFAGLDVSVKQTSVCIVDGTGRLAREVRVASEPEALLPVLKNPLYRFKRIGLEAGPMSQWLFSALAEADLPVICVETRHMRAVLQAQINKTDRNDARGIAQMMRAGLDRPVHVKTLRSQKLRMLLTHRKLLQSKAIAIENDLRASSRNFGLKVGVVGTVKFEARIRELVETLPDLAELVEPLLIVRRTLREQIGILHGRLLAIVRHDDVCRRLMTVPGVGPVVALTYRATVDVPARFRNSKAVGAVFGLTPSRYQSGEVNRTGAISRCGDEMMRAMLYEAAHTMLLRLAKWSWLKAWAMKIARQRGIKKAIVALARRLAVIMHRIWVDGTEFRLDPGNRSSMRATQIKQDRRRSSFIARWNDVPCGTMVEASSHVRLDLLSVRRQGRGKDCSASSSNPMMEGPWCRFRREARARERHRHCAGG